MEGDGGHSGNSEYAAVRDMRYLCSILPSVRESGCAFGINKKDRRYRIMKFLNMKNITQREAERKEIQRQVRMRLEWASSVCEPELMKCLHSSSEGYLSNILMN